MAPVVDYLYITLCSEYECDIMLCLSLVKSLLLALCLFLLGSPGPGCGR